MAEPIFTNKKSTFNDVTTTGLVGSYTCPAGKVATLIGLSVANTTALTCTIGVAVNNPTSGDTFYILKGADLIEGQSYIVVGGDQKVILLPGEGIKVEISGTGLIAADSVMSLFEIDQV